MSVPVAVYNYLPTPQRVSLELRQDPWFALEDGDTSSQAGRSRRGRVTVAYFRIKASKIGDQQLQVTGAPRRRRGQAGDAVARNVDGLAERRRARRRHQRTARRRGDEGSGHSRSSDRRRVEDFREALPRRALAGGRRSRLDPADAGRLLRADFVFDLPERARARLPQGEQEADAGDCRRRPKATSRSAISGSSRSKSRAAASLGSAKRRRTKS